jgi:hypothetical protein
VSTRNESHLAALKSNGLTGDIRNAFHASRCPPIREVVRQDRHFRVDHFCVSFFSHILVPNSLTSSQRNAVYLLSGIMTVILFATSRHILPLSSLRIGDWYLVPSSRGSSFGPSQDKAEKGDSKTVKFAPEASILRSSSGRRHTKRPPALTIHDYNRDSMASMYSAREGVYMAPMSSHWSPDTPPLPSRMSIAFALAQRI